MMNRQVDLLSQAVNFAVVKLPQRNFPGVLIQGDTLHSLVKNIDRMMDLLNKRKLEELTDELEDMREQLSAAMVHYEHVCTELKIPLPYEI
jgi:predicted RNase H-like HicB family nuclease